MRVGVVVVCGIAAVVTWLLALGIAASIPGSPFYQMYGVIERLADPVSGPSAFGEFLKRGQRTKWLSATIFPILSAAVVVLLSRWRFKLRRSEVIAVVVVFLAFVALFGAGLRLAEVVSAAIFAAFVAVGTVRDRSSQPRPNSA